jgi:hypothetical protein
MWTQGSANSGTLTPQACLHLLETPGRGALNLTRHPLPRPVPSEFRLVTHDLLLHAAADESLLAALLPADVTFEVDGTDAGGHEGWHVVLTGRLAVTAGGALLLRPTDVAGYSLAPTRSA